MIRTTSGSSRMQPLTVPAPRHSVSIIRSILLVLTLAFSVSIACAQPQSTTVGVKGNEKLLTGSRQWRMMDGSTRRLRFIEFTDQGKSGVFQPPVGPSENKLLGAFAKEEQEIFAALKNGTHKIVAIPGLCLNPDFPSGKLERGAMMEGDYWYGETRSWVNTAGKRVTARLICLTDEDVSLIVGDSVARVPLANLSAPDLTYLARLKLGQADLFAGQVMLNSPSWENSPDFRFAITGEHYAALAKRKGDFEGALASALRHVGSKLKKGDWELESFSEIPLDAPVHPPSNQPP